MRRTLGVLGALGAMTSVLVMGPVAGQAAPGNNGDIHVVTTTNLDGSPGCRFDVEFSDFDATTLTSELDFSLQAPTLGALTDPIAVELFTFTGGQGLNASASYDLSTALLASGASPTDQGYHVKVETHTPFSGGADGKSKVFWVGTCRILPS